MKHSAAFYVLGPLLITVGVLLLWGGTLGREWNNTHNKALRRVPHFGRHQSLYNTAVSLVAGVLSVLIGLAALIFGT